MSFVAINVLTVPPAMRDTLEQRFAARAAEVDGMEGFEAFELLRPVDGQDRYLVYTRWDSEDSFRAWTESPAFSKGHAQSGSGGQAGGGPEASGTGGGPAASGAELWTFEVAERTTASER